MHYSEELMAQFRDDPRLQRCIAEITAEVLALEPDPELESQANSAAGENIKVHIKAKRKILEILRPFIEVKMAKTIDDEAIQKARKQFAL